MTIKTENLERSLPFTLKRAEGEEQNDGLTLDGYAAVFGTPTLINSWEGFFYEQIRKGAFRKSIRERTPVLQFDHGHHPLIGSIPIGRITELSEDDAGLHTVARLSSNWLVEPVRQAIADESVTGMSFRFSVVREEWTDKDGKRVSPADVDMLLWDPGERGPLTRTLIEVKVHELGPVVFPAYAETSVGVRARSVADTIRTDDEMRREVRAALARETTAPAADDLTDPETRREVARALLFGDQTTDAPPEEHPSETRTEDAPAAEGHPSEGNDAPPSGGHPSGSPNPYSDQLRSQIKEIAALMRTKVPTQED